MIGYVSEMSADDEPESTGGVARVRCLSSAGLALAGLCCCCPGFYLTTCLL
jgi:hypothetical protein